MITGRDGEVEWKIFEGEASEDSFLVKEAAVEMKLLFFNWIESAETAATKRQALA
jgi:hypothetical protein